MTIPLTGGGPGAGTSVPPSDMTVTFADKVVSTADADTFTASGFAIGSESATRRVLFGVFVLGTSVPVPTVTIDAGATTRVGSGLLWNFNQSRLNFYVSDVFPTGTTADIVVSAAGAGSYGLATWALTDLQNPAPSAEATDITDPLSQSLDVLAGGVIVALAQNALTATYSWGASLTEKFDQTVEGVNTWSGASAAFAAGSTETIAVTPNAFSVGGLYAVALR